ncbi:hypothetical protein Q5752_000545 [Cryptotrichosporon argae]
MSDTWNTITPEEAARRAQEAAAAAAAERAAQAAAEQEALARLAREGGIGPGPALT